MKANSKIIRLVTILVGLGFLTSCENLTTCKKIEKSETLMLFDISDEALFAEIKDDLSSNFSVFMKQTKFANIQECQQAKMSVGTLSGKDELKIKSATIGIKEKGLSGQEKRKRGNPATVVQLIKKALSDYSEMSRDVKYNSSTNILGTTVKSIIGMDVEAENTLLIFSDMVINNKIEIVHFYGSIPKDAKATVRKLIDPILMDKLKNKIEEGLELKIIVVLKDEQANKVKKRDVKTFWVKAFEVLEFEDIQFIDNLTNDIVLWGS